jgi:hypothetical protein
MGLAEELTSALTTGSGITDNELVDKLRGLLGLPNAGRSPVMKPLRDLRAPTTAKGRLNRPHFEWSAEDDGQTFIAPFPRLYWNERGHEVRIEDEEDLLARVKPDWTDRPPITHQQTERDRADALLASLSPEDRQFVLEAQRKTRLDRIRETLSGLSAADIAALTASHTPVEKKIEAVKEPSKKTA